jgi:ubiquinone/menaquinone biosynthesis C-methylase UbiE
MTPEMLDRARKNAADGGFTQVEFRLGEIENLPIGDESANLVISNCVINLSPDKARVFSEAHRVLVPGGQMMVSDLVLTKQLPDALARNVHLLTGCIAGAMVQSDYLDAMHQAGFAEVTVEKESEYLKLEHLQSLADEAGISPDDAAAIAQNVRSISVRARKAN